jgi:hypothetical protein
MFCEFYSVNNHECKFDAENNSWDYFKKAKCGAASFESGASSAGYWILSGPNETVTE